MRQRYQQQVFAMPLYLSVFVTLVLLVFSAPLCRAEVGFDIKELKRIASFDKNKRGEPRWFRLPGTNIKAGAFTYTFVYDPPMFREKTRKKEKKEEWTMKAALLVNNSVVYFVNSEKTDETNDYSDFDVGGDCHFGTYENYFLMDCINIMANGHNGRMFLFRYSKDKVELLDVIIKAHFNIGSKISSLDFESETVDYGEWTPNGLLKDEVPIPAMIKDFKDIDNDKAPEVLLWVSRSDRFVRKFYLYFEIKNNRLSVDFNPELYKPIFEREKKLSSSKKKTNAYYISGFLSGRFTIEQIKSMLTADKEQYDDVVPLLDNAGRWDAAFHEYRGDGGKPELKHTNINWR